MSAALKLTGQTFGRLYVQNKALTTIKEGHSSWDCVCQCGNAKTVLGTKLKEGHVQSCGCLIKDKARELAQTLNSSHNLSSSSEYSSWENMKSRCLYESTTAFHRYGGRGIQVCDRWLNSFENFYNDMGPKPTPEHSIDRYPNNDGNYEPGNCRWATQQEQCSNTRRNVIYEYQGREYTRTQLCALTGVNVATFTQRIEYGKTIEEALK